MHDQSFMTLALILLEKMTTRLEKQYICLASALQARQILPEMCRETLNPHISTGTSNLNVQIVFVSSLFMTFISLPCCFGEPLSDVSSECECVVITGTQ